MRTDCKSCKKWKEEMYWSQFQVIQFFQILSGLFHQQVAIPRKFADNLREKLEASVRLTGPSGATWNVELIKDGDTLFLKHGWKEFVDAHSLEENDLLIFKYIGASQFDVSVFDKQSSCEKEASYFVKKCEHADVASGSRTKRPIPVSNDTTSKSSSHDVREAPATATKKPKLVSSPTSMHTSKSSSHEVYATSTRKERKLARTPTSRARGTRANANLRSRKIKSTSTRTGEDTFNKQKALDLATAAVAATPNSFLVVMKPSHVSLVFCMTVPAKWARMHLPRKSVDVILRVKENTWVVNFNQTNHGGELKDGWKKFVLKNFLEVTDVCVFNLISGENEAPIFDVSIFSDIKSRHLRQELGSQTNL